MCDQLWFNSPNELITLKKEIKRWKLKCDGEILEN